MHFLPKMACLPKINVCPIIPVSNCPVIFHQNSTSCHLSYHNEVILSQFYSARDKTGEQTGEDEYENKPVTFKG